MFVCVCACLRVPSEYVDVKLLPGKFSRGMERTYEAPPNEAPHISYRISPGTTADVPAKRFQFSRRWQPAKPTTGVSILVVNFAITACDFGLHVLRTAAI